MRFRLCATLVASISCLSFIGGCADPDDEGASAVPAGNFDLNVPGLAWVVVEFPLEPESTVPNVVLKASWETPLNASFAQFAIVDRAVSREDGSGLENVGPGIVSTRESGTRFEVAAGVGGRSVSTSAPLPANAGDAYDVVYDLEQNRTLSASSYRLDRADAAMPGGRGYLLIAIENEHGWPGHLSIEWQQVRPRMAYGGMQEVFMLGHEDLQPTALVKAGAVVGYGMDATLPLGNDASFTALGYSPMNEAGASGTPATAPTRATLQRPDGRTIEIPAGEKALAWSGVAGDWRFLVEATGAPDGLDRPVVFGISWPTASVMPVP